MKSLAIVGGAGRMGQELARGLGAREEFRVVALVDEHEPREFAGARYAPSLRELNGVALDVVVDFSSPAGVLTSAAWCAEHGVALVVGTTGLGDEHLNALRAAAVHVGVVVASNFALGAVLAERFAALAAPYFERVEIIELHHDRKIDAPSGTAIATAHVIADARRVAGRAPLSEPTTTVSVDGARGANVVDGVVVHSVRLPGLVAHEEILFGSTGEGLTIRHDSYQRTSFVPGVAIAVSYVDAARPELLRGIGSLL